MPVSSNATQPGEFFETSLTRGFSRLLFNLIGQGPWMVHCSELGSGFETSVLFTLAP